MTPLEKIKQGITVGDWQFIKDAYKDLTGEEVEFEDVPTKFVDSSESVVKKDDQIFTRSIKKKKLHDLNTSDQEIESIYTGLDINHPTEVSINKDSKEKIINRNKKNKFNPEDYETEVEKELSSDESKKLNDNVTPTPRTRASSKKVDVYCLNCEKNIEFAPSLVKPNPELENEVVPKGCNKWMFCEYADRGKACPYK